MVGVRIERSDEPAHHAAGEAAAASAEQQEADGAGEAEHAEGEATEVTVTTEEPHAELGPLGVDVEAWPFMAAAALASLALAAGAWLRRTFTPLLTLVALVMLVFAALDVREVFHQVDIKNEIGLAVLVGAVAALHLAAAAVGAAMASHSRSSLAPSAGPAGTMAA